MKHNLKKKFLAWGLSLVMAVTLFPAAGGMVYADDQEPASVPESVEAPVDDSEAIQPQSDETKTTITELDYTGFIEPAIGDTNYYRKMTKNIQDKTHSDITGALDGSMLYKYNDDGTLTQILSEELYPYTFE